MVNNDPHKGCCSLYDSSSIQTVLSVLELHQLNQKARGLSPPVGNCTLPRRFLMNLSYYVTAGL